MENIGKNLVGACVISVTLIFGYLFRKTPNQKIYIKNIADTSASISDTLIVANHCRFYYTPNLGYGRDIEVSFYKDLEPKPYLVQKLISRGGDYVDVELESGKNKLKVKSLGMSPFIDKKFILYKIKERN